MQIEGGTQLLDELVSLQHGTEDRGTIYGDSLDDILRKRYDCSFLLAVCFVAGELCVLICISAL